MPHRSVRHLMSDGNEFTLRIEAGGYAGTRYCIEKFGNSRIDWAVGPDTEPGRLTIADNTLVFRGTCQRP